MTADLVSHPTGISWVLILNRSSCLGRHRNTAEEKERDQAARKLLLSARSQTVSRVCSVTCSSAPLPALVVAIQSILGICSDSFTRLIVVSSLKLSFARLRDGRVSPSSLRAGRRKRAQWYLCCSFKARDATLWHYQFSVYRKRERSQPLHDVNANARPRRNELQLPSTPAERLCSFLHEILGNANE